MAAYPSWYSKYASAIQAASAQYGVPVPYIVAVITQESGGDPNAVSSAGAIGLMQKMGGSFDPATNINEGTSLLASLLSEYNGDVTKALAAYNTGPGNLNQYGLAGVLNDSWAGGQTLRYVTSVEALIEKYGGTLSLNTSAIPVTYSSTPGSTGVTTGTGPTSVPTPFGSVSLPSISLPSIPDVPGAIQSAGQGIIRAVQQITSPFTAGVANLTTFLSFLSSPKTTTAVLMILFGILLTILGVILFGLSLVSPEQAKDISSMTGKLTDLAAVAE